MLDQQTKVFFPNLDGLRFFAFFAVFVNHAMATLGYRNANPHYDFVRDRFLLNGDLGVNFFFVLSGFLITYLLLKEKEIHGKINIKHFYLRRVLRIWPLYFLIVCIALFVLPHFATQIPHGFPMSVKTDSLNPWLYVGFAGNFDYILHGITNVFIGVLWSVSVEEQFYLFWPLLIAFIPRKFILPSLITIVLGSIAFRFFGSHGGNAMILKYHSLSSISDLTTGAIFAYLATKQRVRDVFKKMPRAIIILMYVLFVVMMPFRAFTWKFGLYYVHVASIVPVVFSLMFAFFIMEQNYSDKSFFKISKSKIISSFGKYTYGMYCYHMVVFFAVMYVYYLMGIDITTMSVITFVCVILTSLCTTILVSKLSYHYFESRFLKLKTKFSNIVQD